MSSIKYACILLLGSFLFTACVKTDELLDENNKYNIYNPDTDAQMKFINVFASATPAAVALSTSASSGPGFRIFVDNTKLDASLNTSSITNVMFYGFTFPGTTNYISVPAGLRNFKFTINRVSAGNFAPIAGDEVYNTTQTITAGKRYTYWLADTLPNPRVFITEDNFKEPIRNSFGIRFVNVSPDVTRRYDLVSKVMGVTLFRNVGYRQATDFIYPGVTPVSDTLLLVNAGTSTIVSQVNGFNPVSQRVYTFYARGKTGLANRAPSLSFYTNR